MWSNLFSIVRIKNNSTYTNSITTCDRETELAVKKNLPTLRKEIILEYDCKVGLVVKSVQYSTYTKAIVRIPTVYQLVTMRQNSRTRSQKETYFEHDCKSNFG